MTRQSDILLTALAPAVWGSTYYVTSEFLPQGYPVTMAVLRALPAGLILLLITRALPPRVLWGRVFLLGALNFTVFWTCLFIAAFRLPGGVAATVGSLQALMTVFVARAALGTAITLPAVLAALAGSAGVGLLVLGRGAALDVVGLLAALGGAASMAAGTVFSRKWNPGVPPLAFTAWQLSAGGLLLVPLAVALEPGLPRFNAAGALGMAYLALVGGALTYVLWFRGVARIAPTVAAALGFFSPVTAVMLGWLLLGQALTLVQAVGAVVVLGSVHAAQAAGRRPAPLRAPASAPRATPAE